MARTRERAADAAITLLGTRGLHALTHGKVDAEAGLPKGSASNHFRTRTALVRGAVERLVERDRKIMGRLDTMVPETPGRLADLLLAFVEAATTEERELTVARYTLIMEGAHEPAVRADLAEGADRLLAWGTQILADLGSPRPGPAARTLMAYTDGIIMRAITRPDIVEPRDQMLRVVRACLSP